MRSADPFSDPVLRAEPAALASRPLITAVVSALGDAAAEVCAAKGDVEGLEEIMRRRLLDAHEDARVEVNKLRADVRREVGEMRGALRRVRRKLILRLLLASAASCAMGFALATALQHAA
ncbi:MAG: hypothetical protein AAF684_07285 [Pseudomonadota bacterium]